MRLPLGQNQVTGEVKAQKTQVGTKLELSRDQVKGEVTPPVTPPVERLIEVLGEHGALGAADIRDKLGLKDRAHVREAYLNPSMDAGLVEYTIPEKPQSRLQRYRLTEAGRKLVEHLRQEKLN